MKMIRIAHLDKIVRFKPMAAIVAGGDNLIGYV
jgi:hypothetical protein